MWNYMFDEKTNSEDSTGSTAHKVQKNEDFGSLGRQFPAYRPAKLLLLLFLCSVFVGLVYCILVPAAGPQFQARQNILVQNVEDGLFIKRQGLEMPGQQFPAYCPARLLLLFFGCWVVAGLVYYILVPGPKFPAYLIAIMFIFFWFWVVTHAMFYCILVHVKCKSVASGSGFAQASNASIGASQKIGAFHIPSIAGPSKALKFKHFYHQRMHHKWISKKLLPEGVLYEVNITATLDNCDDLSKNDFAYKLRANCIQCRQTHVFNMNWDTRRNVITSCRRCNCHLAIRLQYRGGSLSLEDGINGTWVTILRFISWNLEEHFYDFTVGRWSVIIEDDIQISFPLNDDEDRMIIPHFIDTRGVNSNIYRYSLHVDDESIFSVTCLRASIRLARV